MRWLFAGRADVADDEELLARADQAELAAGDLLDRRGFLAEAAGFLAEARVIGAGVIERSLERVILLARLHHCQQPLLADQRVDDQHAADEHEQVLHRTAPAARS